MVGEKFSPGYNLVKISYLGNMLICCVRDMSDGRFWRFHVTLKAGGRREGRHG